MKICPPRQKGHAFCDQKPTPPKPWTLKFIFDQKNDHFLAFWANVNYIQALIQIAQNFPDFQKPKGLFFWF